MVAEDGPIPVRCKLQEMPSKDYLARTEANVVVLDVTVLSGHAPAARPAFTRAIRVDLPDGILIGVQADVLLMSPICSFWRRRRRTFGHT